MAQRPGNDSLPSGVGHEGMNDLRPSDFNVPEAPTELIQPVMDACVLKSNTGGDRESPTTTHARAAAARRFLRDIAKANPGLRSVADLTPSVLETWFQRGRDGFAPSTGDIGLVRALLACVEGLPTPTRDLLRKRWPTHREPYSAQEQNEVVAASWGLIAPAVDRLHSNTEALDLYRSGNEPSDAPRARIRLDGWRSAGEVLDHIARFGEMPGAIRDGARELRAFLGVPRSLVKHALFLRTGEVLALQILLVAECGHAPETLHDLEVGSLGISAADSELAAFVDSTLLENPPDPRDSLQQRRTRVHRIAEFLTRPARETLAALGHPTDLLLIAGARSRDWGPRTFPAGFIAPLRGAGPAADWQLLTGVECAGGTPPALTRLSPAARPNLSLEGVATPVFTGRHEVRDESDTDDFSDLTAVHPWSAPLVEAYWRLAGRDGKWRSPEAAHTGAGVLRRVVRELAAAYPYIEALGDITTHIRTEWRIETIRRARGSRAVVDVAQALFAEAEGTSGADASGLHEALESGGRTAASLPEPGPRSPEHANSDELRVTAFAAGALMCDFSDLDAPMGFLKPIVDGFRRKVAPGGGWNSRSTVHQKFRHTRRFVQAIITANPNLNTIGEFTPEVWWAWAGPPGGGVSRATVDAVRGLLSTVVGLPDLTKKALRPGPRKSGSRPVLSYRIAEAQALVDAALEMIAEALQRIQPNRESVALFRRGEEPADTPKFWIANGSYSIGRLLDHQLRTGRIPGRPRDLDRVRFREELGLVQSNPFATALFLTPVEIYSLMILLVWEGGYNVSSLNGLQVGSFRADDRQLDPPLLMIEHNKPRRGARSLSSETLIGPSAELHAIAEYLTEPAREARAALGHPTDALLVGMYLRAQVSRPEARLNRHWDRLTRIARAWTKRTGVTDHDGRHPNLMRFRTTHQVVQEVPRQNTMRTHWDTYRRDDPQTLEKARDLLPKVQDKLIGNAKAHAHEIRILSAEAASAPTAEVARQLDVDEAKVPQLFRGDLNTACLACRDIRQSPYGEPGQLCPVSPRTCFRCPNSIMTLEHLPGTVVYRDEMVASTRHLSDAEWERDYADHYSEVSDAISLWTPEEVAAAREAATQDHVVIARALLGLHRSQ